MSTKKIRVVAGVDQRIDTGPLQFGKDWPGVFIRGDSAMCMATDLRVIAAKLTKDGMVGLYRARLISHADLLASCIVPQDSKR